VADGEDFQYTSSRMLESLPRIEPHIVPVRLSPPSAPCNPSSVLSTCPPGYGLFHSGSGPRITFIISRIGVSIILCIASPILNNDLARFDVVHLSSPVDHRKLPYTRIRRLEIRYTKQVGTCIRHSHLPTNLTHLPRGTPNKPSRTLIARVSS